MQEVCTLVKGPAALLERIGWNRALLIVASVVPFFWAVAILGLGFFHLFPAVPILWTLAFLGGILLFSLGEPWTVLVASIPTFLAGVVLKFVAPNEAAFLSNPSIGGPKYPFDIFALWAGLVGIVCGILTYRTLRKSETIGMRRWAALASAILLVVVGFDAAVVVAQKAPAQSGGTLVAFAPDASLNLTEEGTAFSPTSLTLKVGEVAQLAVLNKDAALHSFTTTDGPRVDADTLTGRSTTVLLRAPLTPMTWHFFCKYHANMQGTITVTA